MSIIRGFKIKLTPDAEQARTMDKWRRASLSLWNVLLGMEQAAYDGSKYRPELHWRKIWADVVRDDYIAAAHAWVHGKYTKAGVLKKAPGTGKEPVAPTAETYAKIAGTYIDGQPPKLFIWQSDLKKIMARLKNEELSQWIAVLPSHAAQQICDDINDAIKTMLSERAKRLRGQGGRNTGFPRFKKNRYAAGSVYMVNSQTVFDHEARMVSLPKLKLPMPFRQEDLPKETLMGGRLWRQGEQWWISCQFKVPDLPPLPATNRECGLKISAGVLATVYDGKTVQQTPPMTIDKKLMRRIKLANRRLSRRHAWTKTSKGTKDYYETANELAMLHAQDRNRRDNMLHHVSRDLVNSFDGITVHKMDVAPLMEKRDGTPKRLLIMNKNAAMAQFRGYIGYKAKDGGRTFNETHAYFPEVQKCHFCGKLHAMPLEKRTLTCECGTVVDRRGNAAANEFSQGRLNKMATAVI